MNEGVEVTYTVDFEYESELLLFGDLLQRAEDKGIKITGWDVFGK